MLRHLATLLIGSCLAAPNVFGHGDLHEQIATLTSEIQKSPGADNYLKRGELYRLHEEFSLALADFDRAEQLDRDSAVDFLRGRTLAASQMPIEARKCLDRFLKKNPTHVEALVTRAGVLRDLSEYESAARDFTQAIKNCKEPQPEYFIERAKALALSGELKIEEAIAGLDEGVERLGPLVTLQLEAVELELGRGHYDAALKRVDAIATQSSRKEMWLARKAEILLRANRFDAAQQHFKLTLKAIDSLPLRLRETSSMQQLKGTAEKGLLLCSHLLENSTKGGGL